VRKKRLKSIFNFKPWRVQFNYWSDGKMRIKIDDLGGQLVQVGIEVVYEGLVYNVAEVSDRDNTCWLESAEDGFKVFPDSFNGSGFLLSGGENGPGILKRPISQGMIDLGLGYACEGSASQALNQRRAMVNVIREKQRLESFLGLPPATFKSTTKPKFTLSYAHEHNRVEVVQNNKRQYAPEYWTSESREVLKQIAKEMEQEVILALGVVVTKRRKKNTK
jgi:hypothetical protein